MSNIIHRLHGRDYFDTVFLFVRPYQYTTFIPSLSSLRLGVCSACLFVEALARSEKAERLSILNDCILKEPVTTNAHKTNNNHISFISKTVILYCQDLTAMTKVLRVLYSRAPAVTGRLSSSTFRAMSSLVDTLKGKVRDCQRPYRDHVDIS